MKPWRPSSISVGCRKPKEKTDRRTPLSILQPGWLGVRCLPQSRPGNQTTLWLDTSRFGVTRTCGVGQWPYGGHHLSEILHLGTKHGMA